MNPIAAIPVRYLCWGRLCQCGERVTTWRIREDQQVEAATLPSSFRFYCRNGHVHFPSMHPAMCAPLQWVEEGAHS